MANVVLVALAAVSALQQLEHVIWDQQLSANLILNGINNLLAALEHDLGLSLDEAHGQKRLSN